MSNTIFSETLEGAFAQAALPYPQRPMELGKLSRFATNVKKGDRAGWCKLFLDGKGAVFGCHRRDVLYTWQYRQAGAPPVTAAERIATRQHTAILAQHAQREVEDQHVRAAAVARRIFGATAVLDQTHPYVARKLIAPYLARLGRDGSVVLPILSASGALQSLQFIRADGEKRFLRGAKMKGGRLIIGTPVSGQPMTLAEGWATGCSLHEATEEAVVICFSGANLVEVAVELRGLYPDSPLRIAGDLDAHGMGLKYATAAATAAAPSVVVLPRFSDERSSGDFNDLCQAEGKEAVRRQLASVRELVVNVVDAYFKPALSTCDARDGTADSRPLTELGNAQRLFDAASRKVRYVHDAKSWILWNEGAWQWNDGAAVRALAARVPTAIYEEGARHLADGAYFAKWARKSQEHRVIKAAVDLFSDFASVRLPLAALDSDILMVGLDDAKKLIDLRSGIGRDAIPDDFITKSLGVGYIGNATEAVRWLQFLDQVFMHDHEIIAWIQRFCGYLLTGSTAEQIFLFCFGQGANGKSVFIEVLKYISGDYSRAIGSETLCETKRHAGGATPDLAALIGARLVISSESEDNTALAESLVKSLVSGDTIAVRQLYSAPVQFKPHFKLVMAGNHKPVVKGNDHGIWRRVRLVPFNRTFSPGERDPHLLSKLKNEGPHILAWMVQGFNEWQRVGLADTPAAIRHATESYQADQDLVGRWLDECTKPSPQSEVASTAAYTSYKAWCIDNGLHPASAVALGRRLGDRGYTYRKSNGARLWRGLKILDAPLRYAMAC